MSPQEDEDKVKDVDDGGSDHEPEGVAENREALRCPVVLPVLQWQNVMAKFQVVLDSPGDEGPQVGHNWKEKKN